MDNLLGFCFIFTFFYRYALRALIYTMHVVVFKQEPTDTSTTFLCNACLAGYLGFLLLRKSFLETHAHWKIAPIGPLGVLRFCSWSDKCSFEDCTIIVYEVLIPATICAFMMLSNRFRPHY